jgi:hypothetical protein
MITKSSVAVTHIQPRMLSGLSLYHRCEPHWHIGEADPPSRSDLSHALIEVSLKLALCLTAGGVAVMFASQFNCRRALARLDCFDHGTKTQ